MFQRKVFNRATNLNKIIPFLVVALLSLFNFSHASPNPTKEPIIIGIDADMSGVAKVGGQAIYRGARIAIDKINANGGLLGRELQLEVKDHRGNPARGIKNIEALASNPNVVAVIGGVHTPVALAELPTIHEKEILYLGAWAAGTSIVENNYYPNYVFRVSVRDSDAGEVLVKSAKERGLNKIALVLERTGWGRSNQASIKAAAEKYQIEITHIAWINWRQTDFTNEMATTLATKPEALLLVSNAPEGAIVAKNMIKSNANLPLISHWGIAGGKFVELLGFDNLQKLDVSVLQSFHFEKNLENSVSQHLFKQYQKTFSQSETTYSVEAAVGVAQSYDIVNILAKAIANAQSAERSDVRQAMYSVTHYEGAIKTFAPAFEPQKHDALVNADYFMTQFNSKGHLVPVEQVMQPNL